LPREKILSPLFFTHACIQTADKLDLEREKLRKLEGKKCFPIKRRSIMWRGNYSLCQLYRPVFAF